MKKIEAQIVVDNDIVAMAFPQQQHLQADKHSNKPNNYICIFSTTTFLFVFTISMISAMPVQQKTHQRRMQRHIVIRPAQITAPSDNVILAAKAESEADGGEESTRRRHDFAIVIFAILWRIVRF